MPARCPITLPLPARRVFDTATGDKLQELRRGADKAEIYSIAFNADSSMLACTSDRGTVHIFKLRDSVHDRSAGGVSSMPPGSTPISAVIPTAVAPVTTPVGAEDMEHAGSGGALAGSAAAAGHGEAKGVSSLFSGLLPKYFSSEWSFAQYRVKEGRSIVAFGQEPHTVISAFALVVVSAQLRRHVLCVWCAVVGADGSFNKANYAAGGEAERLVYSQFVKSDTTGEV